MTQSEQNTPDLPDEVYINSDLIVLIEDKDDPDNRGPLWDGARKYKLAAEAVGGDGVEIEELQEALKAHDIYQSSNRENHALVIEFMQKYDKPPNSVIVEAARVYAAAQPSNGAGLDKVREALIKANAFCQGESFYTAYPEIQEALVELSRQQTASQSDKRGDAVEALENIRKSFCMLPQKLQSQHLEDYETIRSALSSCAVVSGDELKREWVDKLGNNPDLKGMTDFWRNAGFECIDYIAATYKNGVVIKEE